MITNLITSRDDYSLAKHPHLMTGGERDGEYYDGMAQKISRLPIAHVLDMVCRDIQLSKRVLVLDIGA
jgi:hypothetical protein